MERKVNIKKIGIIVTICLVVGTIGLLGALLLFPKVEKGPDLSYGENPFKVEKVNTYYECVLTVISENKYELTASGAQIELFSDKNGNKIELTKKEQQHSEEDVFVTPEIEAGEYILKLYVTDRNVEVICSICW